MNAQTKIEKPEGLALLRMEFPAHQISQLPKETKAQIDARKADKNQMVFNCATCGGHHHKNANHLSYVGHAALTDRLLDADPAWSWEPASLDEAGLPAFDRSGGLWIRLTVCGVTRLGYGHAAVKPNQDPGAREKEVIGDALRNAAMRFGAALDLWHKGDLHADEPDPVDAEARTSNEPAKRQKLDGPCTSATALRTALKEFNRSLEGCGAIEDLEDLLADKETAAILEQCQRDMPGWWNGSGDFVGFNIAIANKRRDLQQIAELPRIQTPLDAG